MSERDDASDLIAKARKEFARCEEAESENREVARADIEFAMLNKQWPEHIRAQREREGRPCLTINKLKPVIRQVVNDARQNKPSIKVHPADSKADPETAEIINGLIRQIEYASNADVAYDTGVEKAVTGGFGYLRIGIDFAHEDAFDLDITINRVLNQFSVYGDPDSTEADSSDWDVAFVVDRMTEDAFEAKYKGKSTVSWDDAAWSEAGSTWREGEHVLVAEWWTREEYDRKVYLLSDGSIRSEQDLADDPDLQTLIEAQVVRIVGERMTKCHKVTQRILNGVEILETREWPGKYIPIVPIYGDEVDVEGKRYFFGLIHDAVDPQRMLNFWRTASTELVALAPRVPFIGEEGAFDADAERWATVNTQSHAFLEFTKGKQPPMRQPLDMGVAAGALQESLNASDDIKAVTGIYDASLGARSNETSGRAIMARQREGDVSTFHFLDNMARAIRHTGRIIIDLIPKVYTNERVIRIIGEDGTQSDEKINGEVPLKDDDGQEVKDEFGQTMLRMRDLTVGKYDLTVTTGPSYTTRREEAAAQMSEILRGSPELMQVIGDLYVKAQDWPGADEMAKRLERLVPPQAKGEDGDIPDEVKQMVQQLKGELEQASAENQAMKMDHSIDMAKLDVDRQKLEIERYKAETDRMQMVLPRPAQPQQHFPQQ